MTFTKNIYFIKNKHAVNPTLEQHLVDMWFAPMADYGLNHIHKVEPLTIIFNIYTSFTMYRYFKHVFIINF